MAQHWIATDPTTFTLEDYDVPAPGPDEVTVSVRAAGVNPADHKHPARATSFPVPIGYEVAGVVSAAGADAGFSVGDEVLAFRVSGGWASELTIPAADVFAKPPALSFPEAANLLLAATTAAEMLHVVGARAGETVLVHGASGAVGVAVLQLAATRGVRVVGTASEGSFERVASFGGVPVAYGDGLADRLGGDEIDAALDCVGTDEAVAVSKALVADPARIVTIAAPESSGLQRIGGGMPASKTYRDSVRRDLISLASDGRLVVPMARTFRLVDALDAVALLRGGHPGGKVALIP
ncbi:NADP-dependent oxidoreductase [Nocardioides sp. CER19]|uniref:NADP-dependent oxidoreductase n=1 Tax=Nocardioides sp. CER19 TaxID=3038538 RepID=UPI002447C555|nr:NADP-dependent oxidoreductase [Nocardioides sp. CER19]MDH2415520.1 NADP-dependent oxidoreductase [Nocardioides sp. CER19]